MQIHSEQTSWGAGPQQTHKEKCWQVCFPSPVGLGRAPLCKGEEREKPYQGPACEGLRVQWGQGRVTNRWRREVR